MVDIFADLSALGFQYEKDIGSGNFGSVYSYWDIKRGESVAIKVLIFDDISHVLNELMALLKLGKHPNVITLYDLRKVGNCVYIVMEKAKGNLDGKKFDEMKTRGWFKQICQAVDYLHNEKMMAHCDIKPANILIDSKGDIKLGDLGLTKAFSRFPDKYDKMNYLKEGYIRCLSPQAQTGNGNAFKNDIWALGMTLFELLTGEKPKSKADIDAYVKKHSNCFSKEAADLLKNMLAKEEEDRYTISQVLKHKWVTCK